MRVVRVMAPAKINLALHITGQRADGYHLLDSLVMLTGPSDVLTVHASARSRLEVTGPMAEGVPSDESNLVLRAAGLMEATATIELEKHLPAAAGIGGGSSDAAACLRGLSLLSGAALPGVGALLSLGADVPVCMHNQMVRVRGIGDDLTVTGPPPDWPMILVNPRVPVPTARVFAGLSQKENAPLSGDFPQGADQDAQIRWLAAQRNDLQSPAIAAEPVIGEVLTALHSVQGALLARMSGSGATCFAIMSDVATRDTAVNALRAVHPEWWIMPADRIDAEFQPVMLTPQG